MENKNSVTPDVLVTLHSSYIYDAVITLGKNKIHAYELSRVVQLTILLEAHLSDKFPMPTDQELHELYHDYNSIDIHFNKIFKKNVRDFFAQPQAARIKIYYGKAKDTTEYRAQLAKNFVSDLTYFESNLVWVSTPKTSDNLVFYCRVVVTLLFNLGRGIS